MAQAVIDVFEVVNVYEDQVDPRGVSVACLSVSSRCSLSMLRLGKAVSASNFACLCNKSRDCTSSVTSFRTPIWCVIAPLSSRKGAMYSCSKKVRRLCDSCAALS